MKTALASVIAFSMLSGAALGASYLGAVAEHNIYFGSDSDAPDVLLSKNLELYEEMTKLAAANNAQILVFPEFGLTAARDSARESLYPFAETFPSVGSDTPCGNSAYNQNSIFARASCMAAKNKIATLVNTIEKVPCSSSESNCPSDEMFLFNTDLLFDENGILRAKYHKSHEWPGLKPPYDQPEEPSQVTYTSSWGVQFGIFTCFDIMWENPPVELVKQGVKHFLYPVQQGEIGERTIISSWSERNDVTILSANLGAGDKDCSGIIRSGKDLSTTKIYLNSTFASNENILIASVPF